MHRQLLLLAALSLGTLGPTERPVAAAPARALYVSSSGNDRHDGSSPAKPLRTISHALSRAGPGTTVYLAQGTYHEQVVTGRAGARGAEITVRSLNGPAVVDGSRLRWTPGGNQNQALVELHHPFVRLVGITIARSPNTGILLNADNITVEGCQVRETRLHGVSTHTSRQTNYPGRHGSMIRNVVLRNNVVERAALAGNGQSVSLIADGFLVSGNTVRNSPREGIDIWLGARRGKVVGNRVHGNKAAGIYVDGASDVSIHGNIVHGNGSGIGVSSEDANYGTRKILVYNNVVYDNGGAGVFIWDEKGGRNGVQDVTIAHNTLIGNKHSLYLAGESNSAKIFNNLGQSSGASISNRAIRSTLIIQANTWLPDLGGFVSLRDRNFRLTSKSPAIDKGIPLESIAARSQSFALISADFDGRPRNSGRKPDAGAFEFQPRR